MRQRDERGSATELALATPVLVLLLLFPVYLARLTEARAEVDGAARDAARAASLSRTTATAATAAAEAAQADLTTEGVGCQRLDVATDTANFRPGGWVSVKVSCTVALGDLALLRLPASTTVTSTFVAPVDALRGVS